MTIYSYYFDEDQSTRIDDVGTISMFNTTRWTTPALSTDGWDISLQADSGNVPRIRFDVSNGDLSEGWITYCEAVTRSAGTGVPYFYLLGDNGDELLRFQITAAEVFSADYWNGSSWISIAITGDDNSWQSAHKLDIHFKIHSVTGFFRIHKDTELVGEVTNIDTTNGGTNTQLANLDFRSPADQASGSSTNVGHITVSDTNSLGFYWESVITSSNGTLQNQVSGDESQVDDSNFVGTLDDFVVLDDDDDCTFNMNGFTVDATSRDVVTVFVICDYKTQGDPALILKGCLYKSATRYDSDHFSQLTLSEGKKHVKFQFDQDPATAAPWVDTAAIETYEGGLVALTSV